MIRSGRSKPRAWGTRFTAGGFTPRFPDPRRLLASVATLALLACDGDTTVVVIAEDGTGRPIPELELVALPFDPVRLLDSLRGVAPRPAPDFADLEAELRSWRRPTDDRHDALNRPWLALRDSVVALSDSLHTMNRGEPQYATAYTRFRRLYARLAERAAERDRALRDVGGSEVSLARRAAAAADSLRAWEYEAFASYGEVAAAAVVRTGREVAEGTTGTDGTVTLALEPGRWWLVARRPDPDNPFMEHFWSVPVTATRVVPTRIPLTPGNADWRWRH